MVRSRVTAAPTGDLQVFKAAFFKALAHPVRIRILEVLVRGERSVQELQDALGLGQPVGRKEGVSVRYAVRDPLVAELLGTARKIFNNQLAGTQDLLRQLRDEHGRRVPPRV